MQKISKQQKQIILITLLALLFVAAGIFVGRNWDTFFGKDNSTGLLEVDPSAGKLFGDTDTSPQQGDAQSILIPGYETIQVTGGDNLNVALENPAGNPCYFRFKILTEEGEQLYQSGLVPPGEGIPNPRLYRKLSVPTQNVSIQIETLSLLTKEAMNGATIKTVLEIDDNK